MRYIIAVLAAVVVAAYAMSNYGLTLADSLRTSSVESSGFIRAKSKEDNDFLNTLRKEKCQGYHSVLLGQETNWNPPEEEELGETELDYTSVLIISETKKSVEAGMLGSLSCLAIVTDFNKAKRQGHAYETWSLVLLVADNRYRGDVLIGCDWAPYKPIVEAKCDSSFRPDTMFLLDENGKWQTNPIDIVPLSFD